MDWLKRIEKRSEQLDLPSIVPSKVTQMMPDTDLIAPGGRGDGDEAKTEPSDYTAQKTNDQSSFGNQWEEKQQTAEPAKRGCACQWVSKCPTTTHRCSSCLCARLGAWFPSLTELCLWHKSGHKVSVAGVLDPSRMSGSGPGPSYLRYRL